MKKNILLFFSALAASSAAYAHPGHGLEAGFAAGFMHPLSGWDHLLFMFALGIWAARRSTVQGWQLPVLFVVAMTLSAALAMTWLPVSLAEMLIALSLMVMGVLLLSGLIMSRSLQMSLVSLAAVGHGYMHGLEMGGQWSQLAGMVLATAMLHVSGWWLGRQTHPSVQILTQLLGSIMLCCGAVAMFA